MSEPTPGPTRRRRFPLWVSAYIYGILAYLWLWERYALFTGDHTFFDRGGPGLRRDLAAAVRAARRGAALCAPEDSSNG